MKIFLPSAKPSRTKCLEPFKPQVKIKLQLESDIQTPGTLRQWSWFQSSSQARNSREIQHIYNTRGFQSCNISSKACKEQTLLEHFHPLHDGNYIRCYLHWNLREHFRKFWQTFTFPFIRNHQSTLNLPHLYCNDILTGTFSSPCLAQSYK